ncbi:MAG TPA: serine/threonine-protein kinase [Thermoanaerobaculia bacterium]|nr:serine/threonine-protein kinase [Thermoanaerobaculia bacterium]
MTGEPVGQRYGDYEIESFLGKGSIGKVYLARHKRIGRRVALKTVHLEQKFEDDEDRTEFYKRLQREAELCARMQHPNIVTLYDVGYEDDLVSYLATEYIDGESLLARLRRTRPLPLAEALPIAFDVLRGLNYAHSKGIIHRDIKPANILLTSEGQAKIADFGVARPLNSSLTTTRSLVGTPNYMSPEQVKTTPVSPRSDLFSAGVVIYELLTGTKPFASPDLSGILYNVVNLAPPSANEINPSVPKPVAVVVAKLMSKKPDERYADADEALEDLDRASRDAEQLPPETEIETLAVDTEQATLPPMPRRGIPAAAFWIITLLLILGLIATIVTLRKRITAEKPAAVLTRQQVEEAMTKERTLDGIRALTQAGRYEEAIREYDAYLARYPHSIVARDERAIAARLFEESKPKAEVTKIARKPRTKDEAITDPAPPPPAPKPLSRWQRFKKWLRSK